MASQKIFDGARKRKREAPVESERPQKKAKDLLPVDDTDESGSSSPTGGVSVGTVAVNGVDGGFTVNQEFAKRFEHNKKREELHRCTLRLIPH